jgi:transcriptional regulator with XRE-family HTH domain
MTSKLVDDSAMNTETRSATVAPSEPKPFSLRAFREDLRPWTSLREVERRTGIDSSALSKVERGLQWVRPEDLESLASFFSERSGRSVTSDEVASMVLESRRQSAPQEVPQ